MAHGKPIDYTCNSCGALITTPVHCGKPMILEYEPQEGYWICWKGEHEPCCGSESLLPYTACCENPDLQNGPNLKGANILL